MGLFESSSNKLIQSEGLFELKEFTKHLTHHLLETQIKSATIIQSVKNPISLIIKDILNKNNLVFIEYSDSFTNIRFKSRETYLILTPIFCEFFEKLSFYSKQNGAKSMILHWATFMVFTDDRDINRDCLFNSSADNILFVVYTKQTYLKEISTLVWQRDRQRKPIPITLSFIHQLDIYDYFPNLRKGMNGRTVICLCKEYDWALSVKTDISTGRLYYAGFIIDFIDIISEYMNFSCEYLPKAGSDSLPWSEIFSLADNEADIGLAFFGRIAQYTTPNITISYSPYVSKLVGAYFHNQSFDILAHLKTNVLKIVLVAAGIIGVAFFYYMLHYIIHRFHVIKEKNTYKEQKSEEEFPEKQSNTVLPPYIEKDRNKNSNFLEILLHFSATVFNQGHLPESEICSLRLLVSSWAFAGMFLTIMYTGETTANFIQPDSGVPIKNFEDLLLNSAAYKWCLPPEYISVVGAMRQAETDSLLGQLYLGMPYLETNEADECNSDERTILYNLTRTRDKFVIITDLDAVNRFRQKLSKDEASRLVVTEELMFFDAGLIFPKDSEFEISFSEMLSKLDASGVLKFINKKWSGKEGDNDESRKEHVTTLEDIFFLIYYVAFGVLISALSLLIEIVIFYCKKIKSYKLSELEVQDHSSMISTD